MSGSWDLQTDVLVVGAGGCGLVAALAADEQGVEVAVVEKFDKVGGNTSVSTGSVPGAGTRFQRAAGIDDSPERMLEDLLRTSGPHEVPELTRLLAYQSASLVEWLVDRAGARIELVTDYRHVGHSVPRLHAPRSRKGRDLTDDLVRALRQRDIPIALSNPVTELIVNDGGAVIGAALHGERGVESRVRAKKIILATNGFGASPELVRRYCPDIAGATYFGAEGSTGEAILRTLEAYGAAARGERRDAFGRTDFGLAPLRPPYAICQVTPGLFHTQGGLRIDEEARVLGQGGRVIPNLFAGGGAAAGISGRAGGAGYASGNGLLTALGLGRIAGLAAAREIIEGA